MDVTITMRVCDECKRRDRPATRYTLTAEEGEPVTRDLCDDDAAPLLAVFGDAPKEEKEAPPQVPVRRPAKKVAAKKATAKKATAKKATTGRRTRILTMAEIEAEKAKNSKS
ncbi:hypothetical protein ACWDCL_01895 [Streptomyces sp. NPDC001009]